ncbi:MAG TPA: GNA1162 family protein [Myxococcales bacterium]|nr:GNA1162 family protein [Myxococcales bacterium]
MKPLHAILLFAALAACARQGHKYHDAKMDFSSIHTVAVMPFGNLSRDNLAADRVRDKFSSLLLASGAMYVLPIGEVARGITRASVANPVMPSKDEVIALGKALGAEAVITGTLTEYGEVRAGTNAANVVSLTLEMLETTTGTVVWSASTTKGGIGIGDRLLGGGGAPMNGVTEDACHDLLDRLFN